MFPKELAAQAWRDTAVKDLLRSFCCSGALAGDALRHLLRNDRSVNSFFSSLLLQLYLQRNANMLLKQVDCFPNMFYPCISATELGLLQFTSSIQLICNCKIKNSREWLDLEKLQKTLRNFRYLEEESDVIPIHVCIVESLELVGFLGDSSSRALGSRWKGDGENWPWAWLLTDQWRRGDGKELRAKEDAVSDRWPGPGLLLLR